MDGAGGLAASEEDSVSRRVRLFRVRRPKGRLSDEKHGKVWYRVKWFMNEEEEEVREEERLSQKSCEMSKGQAWSDPQSRGVAEQCAIETPRESPVVAGCVE